MLNRKERIRNSSYLLTSALLFYSAFYYLADIKNDPQLFLATTIHLFLFFLTIYLSKLFHDLGSQIKNFYVKLAYYVVYYVVLVYLLTPFIILAVYIGYLWSKDDFWEDLLKNFKKSKRKNKDENKNKNNKKG